MKRNVVPLLLVFGVALGIGVRGQEQAPPPAGAQAQRPIGQAIAAVSPSVVRVVLLSGEPLKDAPRRRFFNAVGRRREASGFVVGARLVMTHSVLGSFDAPVYEVTTASGARFEARLLRLDRAREVAILETKALLDAPPVKTRPSGSLAPGALLLALGDPFGMARDGQAAATLGVLEGRAELDALETSYRGEVLLTDAAINPGSEGGPLIDLSGRVVGVLAPLARDLRLAAPRSERVQGSLVGYGIPIEEAMQVVRPRSPRARVRLGFQGRAGARGVDVVSVDPLGLAAKGGLLPGDVILTANGRAVRSGGGLRRVVAGSASVLTLKIDRSGRTLELELRLQGAK